MRLSMDIGFETTIGGTGSYGELKAEVGEMKRGDFEIGFQITV